MGNELEGHTCALTGAAGGIGLGIAEAMTRAGALVAMIDILEEEVNAQAERLSAAGGMACGYTLDITDRNAVLACFSRIEKELGTVLVLVNNAGVVDQRPFEEITEEQIDRMMQVNVNGTLFCCQAVAPGMKAAKAGHIINFSSKSGKTGSALMAHYSAAKGAIIAMTHALAFELAPFQVTVNCVCPGITDSTGVWSHVSEAYSRNMKLDPDQVRETFAAKIPLKRLARIDDLVNFVMFLSTRADYCTGQAFNISGGREVH